MLVPCHQYHGILDTLPLDKYYGVLYVCTIIITRCEPRPQVQSLWYYIEWTIHEHSTIRSLTQLLWGALVRILYM